MYARALRKWSLNEKNINNRKNRNNSKTHNDNDTDSDSDDAYSYSYCYSSNTKKPTTATKQQLTTTKQMSLMWLVVALTMLLVFVCTPMNVAAASAMVAIGSTSEQHRQQYQHQHQHQPQQHQANSQYPPHQPQEQHQQDQQRIQLNFEGATTTTTRPSKSRVNIKKIPTENVGHIEESYYIPVDDNQPVDFSAQSDLESEPESVVVSKVATSNIYSNRLINTLSGSSIRSNSDNRLSSSSISISRSSISDKHSTVSRNSGNNSSNSNSSNSDIADSLMYSYYRRRQPVVSAATTMKTTAATTSKNTTVFAYTQQDEKQQKQHVAGNMAITTDTTESSSVNINADYSSIATNKNISNDEDEVKVSLAAKQLNLDDLVRAVAVNGIAASASSSINVAYVEGNSAAENAHKSQKVPNNQNSQKYNYLYNHSRYANSYSSRKIVNTSNNNSSNNNNNSNNNNITISSNKNYTNTNDSKKSDDSSSSSSSRGVLKQKPEQRLLQKTSTKTNIREDLGRVSKIRRHIEQQNNNASNVVSTTKTPQTSLDDYANAYAASSSTTKAPFRYIIESFEVPSTLPLSGELTDLQRRMLLHQQHLHRMRMLQEQQAPRNRRDSHTFGILPIAKSVNSNVNGASAIAGNRDEVGGLGAILPGSYHAHFYSTPVQTPFQRLQTYNTALYNSNINSNINAMNLQTQQKQQQQQQQQQQRIFQPSQQYQHQRQHLHQHQSQHNNNHQYQQQHHNLNHNHNHHRQQQQQKQQQIQQQQKNYHPLEQQPQQQPQHQQQKQQQQQEPALTSKEQSQAHAHEHASQWRSRDGYPKHSRKHARRYCSARDPAQLAFEAPTVFEGKIISMTPDRRANFSATVEVLEVFKQQIGYLLNQYVRLRFAYRNNSGECDIYREQLRPRGLVRGDELEQGRTYLLFVRQIDSGNFTILGQPIRKTRRVVDAVKEAVSENYAQLASIRSITASNRTVENGKELRIICRVQGRPPPKVTWFKDHKSINRNRKLYQFVHYKKRSELIIRSFNSSDAGRYECRAKNKVNRNLERRTIAIKAYPVPRYETHLTGGTGNNCPDDASEFCFNGGTCKFFSEIGSYSCICPEGFIGERCDRKEVNSMPPSTYSNEQECGEKKYLGSYYC